MVRKAFTFGAGLLLATASVAQDRPPPPGGECGGVFDFVTGYVERNYAGFPDKVAEADRQGYERHKATLRSRIGSASTDAECQGLLTGYLDFFHDPHLGLVHAAPPGDADMEEDAIRERFADWPVRPVSEQEVRAYLDGREPGAVPIEGIWEVVGSNNRLAILPDASGGGYEAVTLQADGVWWTPGQIKARFEPAGKDEYRVDYYLRDHSLRSESARLEQGLLLFSGVPPWAQVHPRNPSRYDPARYREWEAGGELGLRALDPDTLLLRLPTFEATAEAAINGLVEENWDRLSGTDTLIIDVRGNPGGGVAGYHSLRPLLYTGAMLTPGVSHYATEENIRVIREFMDNTAITGELAYELEKIIAGMREHLGDYVPTPDDRFEIDEVLPAPRRVAVLVDRGCVSTCEAFVWIAMQSGKTTVFGRNTGGFMDYGSALMIDTPSPAFRLQVPMARSNRVPQGTPLDNVGIEPDVRIPDSVLYWVDWVREELQ